MKIALCATHLEKMILPQDREYIGVDHGVEELLKQGITPKFAIGDFDSLQNRKSLDDLKDGARIAVPNDGSNESRALALLAKNNLIELNDDTLYTASSITANPHNYKIEELEAANLPNNLPDVDVAVINGNYALEHNLGDSTNVLLTESFTDEEAQPYINYLVVKEGNENTAKAKALKKALQSKKVKNYIKKYKGSVQAVFTDPTK